MSKPTLSLIVLYANDLAKTLQFYHLLGLEFKKEKHGKGVTHYSCELNGLVLEIYPANVGIATKPKQGGSSLIGFQVENLMAILEALKELEVNIITPPKPTSRGLHAVVQNPDGRTIELIEFLPPEHINPVTFE